MEDKENTLSGNVEIQKPIAEQTIEAKEKTNEKPNEGKTEEQINEENKKTNDEGKKNLEQAQPLNSTDENAAKNTECNGSES